MSTRRITLAIAILSTIATALLAIKDVLSPAWAVVAAATGSGVYALVRTLQKVRAGATLKDLLSTTEAWGAGLAIVASIVSAVAGVVPPSRAGIAVVVAALLLRIARELQAGGLPSGQPPATPQG